MTAPNSPHSPLVNAAGVSLEHASPKRSVAVKQFVFDWSGLVAIAVAAMTWGAVNNRLDTAEDEVRRLRALNDTRTQSDIQIAATMATKADVQRVSDQVQALAAELRSARMGR